VTAERIARASYPTLYRTARTALERCVRIDEVKKISDEHRALAVYAKQRGDTSLFELARKIQLRAEYRIGQILGSIERQSGKKVRDRQPGRGQIAREHGISAGVAHRALRFARVPQAEFDSLVEVTEPPAPTMLARQLSSINLNKDGATIRRTAIEALRALNFFAETHSAEEVAAAFSPSMAGDLAKLAGRGKQWLDDQYAALVIRNRAWIESLENALTQRSQGPGIWLPSQERTHAD